MSEVRVSETEAQRDALTGLPGIAAMRARLDEWIGNGKASGEGQRLHALLLGLRRFDTVNLAYGTVSGDAALAAVAVRLSRFAARELDGPWLAARVGGSNFVLIANETCSRQRWQLFAGQLADIVAQPIPTSGAIVRLSPRIALLRGVEKESTESVLDRLSQTIANMGRHQGRRIAWADGETTRPGRTAAQLEVDLLHAIDGGEIEVVFQPQFGLPLDSLTGAEALARWNHRKIGRIGAGALFAVAERADHIAPLSRHIARLALEGAKDWPQNLRLSLNVTAFELAADSYADELLGVIAASGFPAQRLTLEVTEQALLADIQVAARTLARLSEAGIRIALDDFGAGFLQLPLSQAAAAGLSQARPFDGRRDHQRQPRSRRVPRDCRHGQGARSGGYCRGDRKRSPARSDRGGGRALLSGVLAGETDVGGGVCGAGEQPDLTLRLARDRAQPPGQLE